MMAPPPALEATNHEKRTAKEVEELEKIDASSSGEPLVTIFSYLSWLNCNSYLHSIQEDPICQSSSFVCFQPHGPYPQGQYQYRKVGKMPVVDLVGFDSNFILLEISNVPLQPVQVPACFVIITYRNKFIFSRS